jgi:hypothetical protein
MLARVAFPVAVAAALATSSVQAAEGDAAAPWYDWFPEHLHANGSAAVGHDSNIIEVANSTATPTDKAGTYTDYTAGLTVDIIAKRKYVVSAGIDGDLAFYPDYSRLAQMRTGAQFSAKAQSDNHQVGFEMAYDRYYLDYKFYSGSVHPDFYEAYHYGHNVTIVGVGFQSDYYVHNHPLTGNGLDGTIHQWYLLDGADTYSRRVEVGVRGQRYTANDGPNSYSSVTPSVGVRWRLLHTAQVMNAIDLKADGGIEFRAYDRSAGLSPREHQSYATANASADYWMCPNAALGALVSYSHRDSNLAGNRFDRLQEAVRLTATW